MEPHIAGRVVSHRDTLDIRHSVAQHLIATILCAAHVGFDFASFLTYIIHGARARIVRRFVIPTGASAVTNMRFLLLYGGTHYLFNNNGAISAGLYSSTNSARTGRYYSFFFSV